MGDRERADEKVFEPAAHISAAGARRGSEGVTLVFAVTVAVALGVACGIWLNASLTPHTSAGAPRPARLLPDARADAPPAPAAQTSPCDGCENAAADAATPARGPDDKGDEAGPKRDAGTQTGDAEAQTGDAEAQTGDIGAQTGLAHAAAAPDLRAEPRHADEAADGSAEAHGVTDAGTVAAASADSSRPVAWQVGAVPRTGTRAVVARANVEGGAAQAGERAADGGAQNRPGPCSLYASASALRVQLGGAVPLILGGPGAGVRINVSTPDWAELAVIFEGPAAGENGWLRYSVRSVGHRPGLYTVHFSTPCGAQTIPVTVK